MNEAKAKPLYTHLYFQVLVAIAIGVALGYFFPAFSASLKPLGDAFIKLIKMMIAPIIFTAVVVGIAKIGDMVEGNSSLKPQMSCSPKFLSSYRSPAENDLRQTISPDGCGVVICLLPDVCTVGCECAYIAE